jgi:Trk K+ transport system NAD-binding subunit
MAQQVQVVRHVTQIRRKYARWRRLYAWLVDLGPLVQEGFLPLVVFLAVWVLGASALYYSSPPPRDTVFAALYSALKVMVFQNSDTLPRQTLLGVVYFIVPFLTIVLFLPNVLSFGRQVFDKKSRMPEWQVALAATYRNHVIVCGLGRVGIRAVTRLVEAGYEVVVIERKQDSEFEQRALDMAVPVVFGDAREEATLRKAGVMSARAVVASIDGDLIDIDIALAARALRPKLRVILRAFNEQMDLNLENTFGINSVFSSSALAAPTFAAATVRRGLEHVVPVGNRDYLLGIGQVNLKVAPAPGETIQSLETRLQVRVLSDGKGINTAHTVSRGQSLPVIGRLGPVEAARLTCEGIAQPAHSDDPETIIICGLGKVGYRMVTWLAQSDSHPTIVVVTRETSRPGLLAEIANLPNVEIIDGDVRETEVLERAHIHQATALAAVTSIDQTNLQTALEARRLNPQIHVVLRVFSDALAEKMTDLFGIHTTYSTSDLSSATLAAAAAIGDVSDGFVAGDTLFGVTTIKIESGHHFAGHKLEALRAHHGLLAIWLQQPGQDAQPMPPLDTTLASGDLVTMVAPVKTLERVRRR